jgi:serine protease AprX
VGQLNLIQMKNIIGTLLILLIVGLQLQGFSQTYSKYVIRFTNKNYTPSTLYTIGNPSAYLSVKAIQRRSNQGIGIVQNDLPVNPAYIDSVRNAGAVTILEKSKWLNSVTIFTNDAVALNKIHTFPFVQKVDSVFKYVAKTKYNLMYSRDNKRSENMFHNLQKVPSYLQTNSKANEKQTSSYDYGPSGVQALMINIDYLHNLGFSGQGMTIGVIDAGFFGADTAKVFDSLWTNNQILGTHDFVSPGGNVFTAATHGMMVLSTMGGNLPGQIVGTAPKADYWLLRSEDANTETIIEEYNWVSAAEFADSVGVDVINSSLGYTEFDNPLMNHTYSDMDGNTCISTIGADIAASKGILVVNSAGNSGNSPWKYIGAPADADSILTVGAVDYNQNPASFTSHGPSFDGRIKPNVADMGENAIIAATNGGGVIQGSGTSFSSPIMAGASACLWQAFPSMNNMSILHYIEQSSSKYSNPDTLVGYGVPNFMAAYLLLSGVEIPGFDKEGFVNAFPNPFTDNISLVFQSSDTQMINIEMFDVNGKRVYFKDNVIRNYGVNNINIDGLNKLAQGLYLIRISSKNKLVTQKLMKR